MATAYDVPAAALIPRVAEHLRKDPKAKPPDWVSLARTGIHTEKAPANRDWWYERLAAVLRKVYMLGPVGSSRLAGEFGGREDRGSKPYHARKGSGNLARAALQSLEEMGLIMSSNQKGRVVSPAGQRLLDNEAYSALVEMARENPELTKYV